MSYKEYEKSIFGRLISYRPRENRVPKEDFFTEAFVGVLEREEKLLTRLFCELSGEETVVTVRISTQESFSSQLHDKKLERPDIILRGEDKDNNMHLLIIESKVWSRQMEKQLEGYSEVMQNIQAKTKKLLYITTYEENIEDIEKKLNSNLCDFSKLRWSDIYHLIVKAQQNGKCDSLLVYELLQFMRELNMAYEINLSELTSIVKFPRFRKKMWDILDTSREKSGIYKVLAGKTTGNWTSSGVKDIGYLSPSTSDGVQICIGIWLDTSDSGDMKLHFSNKEIPVCYTALFISERKLNQFCDKYREYINSLVGKGWGIPLESPRCIIRKSYDKLTTTSDDFGHEFVDFFSQALKDLEDAPFFTV